MDFFELIRWGEIDDVKQMVEANRSILSVTDPKGYPPLILASYNEQYVITEYFLNQGAEVDAIDAAGNTALMGVCFKGYKEIAVLLLEHGADVNIQNLNGATALIYAATFGQTEIAKLLLERGADKTLRDIRGNTAYTHAKFQGVPQLAELLVA
jgi:ankyrin repeat protein